jgi:hypothetical protein
MVQKLTNWSLDDPNEARWDVGRTMRMFSVGMFMSGPLLHLWFNFLLRYFPKRDVLTTIKKIAMSQFIYGPAFTVTFFSLNAFVQGKTDCVLASLLYNISKFSFIDSASTSSMVASQAFLGGFLEAVFKFYSRKKRIFLLIKGKKLGAIHLCWGLDSDDSLT